MGWSGEHLQGNRDRRVVDDEAQPQGARADRRPGADDTGLTERERPAAAERLSQARTMFANSPTRSWTSSHAGGESTDRDR